MILFLTSASMWPGTKIIMAKRENWTAIIGFLTTISKEPNSNLHWSKRCWSVLNTGWALTRFMKMVTNSWRLHTSAWSIKVRLRMETNSWMDTLEEISREAVGAKTGIISLFTKADTNGLVTISPRMTSPICGCMKGSPIIPKLFLWIASMVRKPRMRTRRVCGEVSAMTGLWSVLTV